MRLILTILLYSMMLTVNSQATLTETPGGYTNNGGDDSFGTTNLSASDDIYECVNLNNKDKAIGTFHTFGFNIPAGATITSITLTMEGVWSDGGAPKKHVIKLNNGSSTSQNIINSGIAFSNVENTQVQTDNTDPMWGFNVGSDLTPAIVNSAGFGVEIANIESKANGATFCLDYVALSVEYMTTLPVELLYFETQLDDTVVVFNWATASEINNDYFMIEHSYNGIEFAPIQLIMGAGNSFTKVEYSITNDIYINGYYRLKQVDFDGTTSYSNIVHQLSNNVKKTIIDRVDIMGNPINDNYSGVVIIKYSDGSYDKIYK